MPYEVTVNFNGTSFAVRFSPSWSIARLKNEIARKKKLNAAGIKIIFAGQELPDAWKLENCNMNHSVIHAVERRVGQLTVQAECDVNGAGLPTLNNVELTSEEDTGENNTSSTAGKRSYFFVYCKTCKRMAQGKLRCRCSLCKEGSFVLTQGPNCWEDVLTKSKIHGRCESNSTCPGTTAEFYFKCGEHHGNDEHAPLPMMKSNVKNIPCLTCTDVSEILMVFPCDSQHTMCLDCFRSYCVTSLDSRSFIQTEEKGYTIPCPGNSDACRSAFISEPHHFRLLGNEQYERYQRFAAEECVLAGDGVLCPGRGCGQGIYLAQGERCVVCEPGCGLVFCRHCLREYHNGSCEPSGASASGRTRTGTNRLEVSAENDQSARWEREARDLIRKTTKRCPNTSCNVPVEKTAGCNHMTCSRCKFEWCWICRVAWNRNCQSNHWFRS